MEGNPNIQYTAVVDLIAFQRMKVKSIVQKTEYAKYEPCTPEYHSAEFCVCENSAEDILKNANNSTSS
jgi:hypothetical protein